jgi:FkbM family methyltransferase
MKMSQSRTHKAIVSLLRSTPLPFALLAFRAYTRILRLLAKNICTTTYFGARLYCNPNDLIQNFILLFGVWEPDVSKVIERNLVRGDVFVDVGANIGYDTLLASWRVGQTGKVVAIEASPSTFAQLLANLALNENSANVRAVNVAVSDRPGKLDLFEPKRKIDRETNIGSETTVASRARDGRLVASIDALPLTQILTPDEMKRIRLIKIDVEGAEPPILYHLLENLSKYPETMDVVVEMSVDDLEARSDVFKRMKDAGFSAYAIPNEYSRERYMIWNQLSPLQMIQTLPNVEQDLLFTRRQVVPETGVPWVTPNEYHHSRFELDWQPARLTCKWPDSGRIGRLTPG